MTITRANCDCLNSNYLPHDMQSLLINAELYFNFNIYEDDIYFAVYEQQTTQKILDALHGAFKKQRSYSSH